MNRPLNKGRTRFRYAGSKSGGLSAQSLRSIERFQMLGLRMAGFLHQFKTPLHVIQSQTEILLEDPSLTSETRASIEMIHKNAGRLTEETGSVLALSQGTFPAMQAVSLGRLMDGICRAAEVDCRRKNITLEKDLLTDFSVVMDVLSLEGALHNLVNNAIEAMPKGGVLRIRTLETPDRRRVGIEIKDSGMGMNPQTLRRVLQAPFQTTKKTGTGLGLYIAKYIFRRHKALLQWKSQPGKGTTVTVLFPKANARRLALTPASVPSAPPSPASIEKTPRVRTQNLWSKVFHAFTIIAVMIAPLRATAIPQLLRVQGRFLDNQNVPLTDNLPVRFSIWDSPDGYGNLLWQDVQAVSIQDNAFQVVLGRKTPLPPTVFSGGDRWMEMQIGEDAPLRPRHKIPAQYLQAQIAEVSRVPEPAAPPAAAPTPPGISADEKHDLELQIERYREIATAAQEKLTHEQAAKDELARKQAADAQAEAQSEQEAQEKADRDREAAKAAKAAAHKKAHLHPKPPIEVQVDAESGETKNVYTVQNGDTLKSIAQKLYGRAELWYDLYYLNRDRLGPMGYVSAGQILVLPSKTPDESAR